MATGEAVEGGLDEGERRRRAVLALLLLFLVVGMVAWWILSQLTEVPDVVGLSRIEAADRIREAGFSVGDITLADGGSAESPDTVLEQSPEAGSRNVLRADIDLIVVRRPGERPAEPEISARSLLPDEYLDLPEEGRELDEVGLVPDSPLARSGPRVPLVLGLSRAEAGRILSAAGYGMKVTGHASTTTVPSGSVMLQDPPPAAFAPRGTVVTVWISTGPPE